MLGILEKKSPSEIVANGYISNHNKVRCPRPKFSLLFIPLYFCCFWINVAQINFENIQSKIQRIISDSCFQLKSWFNVDTRAPSIPLLNSPLIYLSCHFFYTSLCPSCHQFIHSLTHSSIILITYHSAWVPLSILCLHVSPASV